MTNVHCTLETPPPMTGEDLRDLRALSELPDDRIDLDDIPELTDAQLAQRVRGAFGSGEREKITVRFDADIVAWLRSAPGYQGRISFCLRRERRADIKNRPRTFPLTVFRPRKTDRSRAGSVTDPCA